MTQYIEKIIDITTGEETIRPYTQDEIAEVENNIAAKEAKIQEINSYAAERQAVLDRLGITAEEAQLILS
jgi:hypothetical protein